MNSARNLSPLFFVLFALAARAQVTASFTVTNSICANSTVTVKNTSTNATSYYWSFCAADFNTTPEAVNLGNPGGKFTSAPVFGSYTQDANGNFYGLVSCYDPGHVVRLNFGNSLLNTPTADDLGNLGGAVPNQAEGIQLLKVGNNWIAVIVGGAGNETNSSPRVVKLDFGNSLANTPTATNWGNIGGLDLPHDLFITKEGGRYIGFTINVQGNTLTRLDFGADFSGTPTGVNMGNIGGLNYPAGMTFVNYNSSWYAFIANRYGNSLTRLSFGSSLLNTPVGAVINNPGGTFNGPRDVSLFVTCDGVYGFVSNELSNNLVKLNFGTDPTSVPQATDLGNIGNLSFPHSISDFFRVGNDIYAFVCNATGPTLTRIRFSGCSDIPGSTLQAPAPIRYTTPGVYNINLLVDLGLPTQTSYCQQITVNALPEGALSGDTVCYGNTPSLVFKGKGAAPFNISYSDGTSSLAQGGLTSGSAVKLPYTLTSPGTTSFLLQTVSDATGCSTSTHTSTNILIAPIPQGGISGSATVCGADSGLVVFQPSGGTLPLQAQLSNGSQFFPITNVSGTTSIKIPFFSSPTNFSLTAITDKFGCTRTSGFDEAGFSVTPLAAPSVSFPPLNPVCITKDPMQLIASETTGANGTGSFSGAGTDPNGEFVSASAGAGPHMLYYSFVADDGCPATDSASIMVHPLPDIKGPALLSVCAGVPVQLAVTGGATYQWTPAAYMDHPDSSKPVITIDSTTTFIVNVTDSNGCKAADTILLKVFADANKAFAVPSGFTPNGDGHNDCFGIRQWGDATLQQFAVFNRNGACVFSTNNPSDCWDGTFRGQTQPADTYVFVIRAMTSCGVILRKGTLVLIR